MKRFFIFIRKPVSIFYAAVLMMGLLWIFSGNSSDASHDEEQIFKVKKHSFTIDVRTIGELEAAHSTSISSLIRGDNAKIMYLIPDGTNVEKGDILVKIDATPFEEKLESLRSKFKEQQGYSAALKKGLDWEISQAEKDDKTAAFEVEAAELELNKVSFGDGPLEISRLKSIMQKALSKLDEFNGYCKDLQGLFDEGYLNPAELKNTLKKLDEEKESYESAKLQYESYVMHVFPMQVKKCEAALKQAKMKGEETHKIRGHAIGKATIELEHAHQTLEGIKLQCNDAQKELALTEIRAPAPGMVVHKDDYRNGQRRKPRIGDVMVRNQIILDLPDLNNMIVKSKVREVDLCKVDISKKATIAIDAYPQLLFSGKVTSIGVLALPEPGKPSEEKYFEIHVMLEKSDPRVRPGMTSRVVIHADKVNDVLAVPVHAIFYDQKKTYCYVYTNHGYEKREVVTGMSNEEWAHVKSGLHEGDMVCLTIPTQMRS